jgi:hypothetical protein
LQIAACSERDRDFRKDQSKIQTVGVAAKKLFPSYWSPAKFKNKLKFLEKNEQKTHQPAIEPDFAQA